MTFSEFKNSISKIGKVELPGAKSHEEMAPLERLLELKNINFKKKKPSKAAVMALFYPSQTQETMLVLILRNTYQGVHSAQIGFPGGRVEPEDENLKATALRETWEEIGILPEKIKIVKELTDIYIPPSNFLVRPFIGIADKTPTFVPQESEVAAIIEVSLDNFLNDEFLVEKILTTSYATQIKVPAFQFDEHVVWGATGMMLNEVKAIMKSLL